MGSRMTQDRLSSARKAQGLKHQIDENLKRVYDAALEEDLPDRFKDLLARLREQEQAK